MKNILNKLTFPFSILVLINLIGYVYHMNFDAACIGSVIGMIVAILVNELRVRL